MEVINSWIAAFSETLTQIIEASAAYMPKFLGAVVLFAVGWIVARLLRTLIERLGSRLDTALAHARERTGFAALQWRWPVSRILGQVVFWVVILFFVTTVAGTLGLPGFVEWLGRVIEYVPSVVAAGLVILVGYWLSGILTRFVRSVTATAGYPQAETLGRLAGGLTLLVAVVIGLEQLRFDISLLVNLITIAAAAALGGLALAFGLGAGPSVKNIIAARYLGKVYHIGQRVRVGETEGRILELNATSVVLETGDGRAVVPAQVFQDQVSLVIEGHGETDR